MKRMICCFLILVLCLSLFPPIPSHAQELTGRTFAADKLLAVEKPLATAPPYPGSLGLLLSPYSK